MIKLTPEKPPYYEIVQTNKKYIALLTQSGANAPVATILKNTYNAPIVWQRDTTGSYFGELTNAFTINKTTVIITEGAAIDPLTNVQAFSNNLNANYIFINSFYDGAASDGQLGQVTIIIETYP